MTNIPTRNRLTADRTRCALFLQTAPKRRPADRPDLDLLPTRRQPPKKRRAHAPNSDRTRDDQGELRAELGIKNTHAQFRFIESTRSPVRRKYTDAQAVISRSRTVPPPSINKSKNWILRNEQKCCGRGSKDHVCVRNVREKDKISRREKQPRTMPSRTSKP